MPHRHHHRHFPHHQHSRPDEPAARRSSRLAAPRPGVPPAILIREDFERLTASTLLRTSAEVEQLILMQSIEGHAHEGHGAFRGRRFVNLTMDDTTRALGFDPAAITAARQQLIDEVVAWAMKALDGKAPDRLVDESGYPLLDVSSLRTLPVDPAEVLRGLYLGGLRDNSEVRAPVEEKYGLKIGGGACYLVNVDVMERLGLDGEQLSHGEYQPRLDEFRDKGLIVDYGDPGFDPDRVRYMYIRHRRGGGTSDDAAVVACGLLWGLGAALGAFLADAIDTFEKYVPHYFDQDDELAAMIAEGRPELAKQDEVELLTYLCAVPEGAPPVPDCSLRHMLMVDRAVDQTPLEGHLLFIQGLPYAPSVISFEQVPNSDFYAYITDRVKKARRDA